ncbi:MAG: hypothetical protein R2843_09270 [Thermomicrobiales bacterium]
MKNAGITTLIELGPGSVLSGLIKRIDRELAIKGSVISDSTCPSMSRNRLSTTLALAISYNSAMPARFKYRAGQSIC